MRDLVGGSGLRVEDRGGPAGRVSQNAGACSPQKVDQVAFPGAGSR
jgi:hypothetical protein